MGLKDPNPKEGLQPLRAPKAKALLVGEDPEDFQYYASILEVCGYDVRACNTFQEGVLRLSAEVYDFVVVSQGTPGFQGRDVLKRAVETNQSLPVLVVARYLDADYCMEAMELGAADYLIEPVTVSVMIRVLESHPPTQGRARQRVRKLGQKQRTAERS
jgi:DNA-binding NtrC family response regulator